jgi:hypothetical protein
VFKLTLSWFQPPDRPSLREWRKIQNRKKTPRNPVEGVQETPTKADTDIFAVTPQKETVSKVPLPPAKPRKTFPPRPPPKKRSSANKSAPGSIPSNQPVPERIKVGESKDNMITEIEDFDVPKNQEIGMGFFEPDGITRDIYVQGSK